MNAIQYKRLRDAYLKQKREQKSLKREVLKQNISYFRFDRPLVSKYPRFTGEATKKLNRPTRINLWI